MRSSRLVSILLLLQNRGRLSAGALAAELEVSVRTIYRDIDALLAAGVPVYADQGRTGGYQLVDGYRTRLTGLTASEAESLFMVGLPAAASALGFGQSAASAEQKLLAALSPDQRLRASVLRDRFHLDLPAWYAPPADLPFLAPLAAAVIASQVVTVTYRRWEEPREVPRTLSPLGLVMKNGVWYVVALASSGSPRTYRVSNVLDLDASGETFERPDSFDLAGYWATQVASWDKRRFTSTTTVRLSPALVSRLPDLSDPLLAAAAAGVVPDDDGWVTVDVPIESVSNAAHHLLRYAGDVEVLSPPELREELISRAQQVVALYIGGLSRAPERPGGER
ncbi:helix-turn-helix transcriptional regulator [Luteipulveratus mongoliensis]|uniref:Transcriptional regulator n=1 Tax=Luteipulveratus mongoliensis TaxID=571913 RepID=A0A0K1JDS2_9MICO|nr:YafY family protein [Luteipulveratus mongoliensis]AKU14854.1 transcriptional regulator [Luteipulveratus mongoliensis]